MDPHDLEAFNRAIQYAQAGDKQVAYRQFVAIAQSGVKDANLFMWLAYTTPDLKEAERALVEVERIEPTFTALPAARSWLQEELAKQPGPPPAMLESRPPQEFTQPVPYAQPQPQYQPAPPPPQVTNVVVQQTMVAAPMVSGFTCPWCGAHYPPIPVTKTSAAGWVVFWVLLLTTIILCPIGLAMKESYHICPNCKRRV